MIEAFLNILGEASRDPNLIVSSLSLLAIAVAIACAIPRRFLVAILCLAVLAIVYWRLL